jgi:hypothetical protein
MTIRRMDDAAGVRKSLSAGDDGVQPNADGEADSDSGAGRLGVRCLGDRANGLARSKPTPKVPDTTAWGLLNRFSAPHLEKQV